MTVKRLLLLLQSVDPNARVVVPAPDHSYRDIDADVGTALYDADSGWCEDHGEDETPEAEYGKRMPVLIIR